MGDRIAVMNQGRIMQVGAPIELYERPANAFVAGFIGSPRMNLLPAEDLLACASASDHRLPPSADERTIFGIRPEHVLIGKGGADGLGIGMARVERIEDLGHEALVHLTAAQGVSLTVRASGDIRSEIETGQDTPLAIRVDRLACL